MKKYISIFLILQSCAIFGQNKITNKEETVNKVQTDKSPKAKNKTKINKVNLKLDKETAIKLAEIILVKVYGKKVLKQRPWIVTDNETEFKITGSTPKVKQSTNSKYRTIYVGGVAEIKIRKSDAKVMYCMHGK